MTLMLVLHALQSYNQQQFYTTLDSTLMTDIVRNDL